MFEDDESGSILMLKQMGAETEVGPSVKVSEVAYTHAEIAVLRQIIFWFPRAKHTRFGVTWLVKSAEEFREHGVLYAPSTIRKAIRALAERGVIETERHFHPFRAVHGPVNFIRPAQEVIDDFSKSFRMMSP